VVASTARKVARMVGESSGAKAMKHKFYIVQEGQLIQLAVYVHGAKFVTAHDEKGFHAMMDLIKTQSIEIDVEE
jgi:hypothetical protein